MSSIKTLISVYLNLETEFCHLFESLPNEEFQGVLNLFVENVKMQHLPLVCSNN